MSAAITRAQGPGIANRTKTRLRASTNVKARPTEGQRMISHRGAPVGALSTEKTLGVRLAIAMSGTINMPAPI